MRFDRLITLGLVAPVRRAAGIFSEGEPRLPVLMYHSVSADTEAGISPYYRVCVSPRRFAAQMQWLADAGYRGVTLAEGLAAMGKPDASKLVAITFDDGFRDFHTAAFPALQRHGFAATMYLPTAFIGDERCSFKGRECLTWSEVRALHQAGMEFGSHTVNHPELVQLDWPAIATELRDSKSAIEQRLGAPADGFAYPYAFPSADRDFAVKFRETLQATGYTTCVTTEIGTVQNGDDRLRLPRLPANECDDGKFLKAKVAGAYNWLALPQRAVKAAKGRRRK